MNLWLRAMIAEYGYFPWWIYAPSVDHKLVRIGTR